MNKAVLWIGLFAMAIAFFYVPYDVPDTMAQAVARMFSNRISHATEIAYGPLWESPHTEGVINTALWLGTLGAIAFATFVLAKLVPRGEWAETTIETQVPTGPSPAPD